MTPVLLLAPAGAHSADPLDQTDRTSHTAVAEPVSRAGTRVEDTDPLAVTIDSMTPSVLGRASPITIRGTVTNTTDETWYAVNVWPHASWNSTTPAPLTTQEELVEGLELPGTDYRGDRFTDPGNSNGTIRHLDPGQTAAYTARITRTQAALATESGVYWVGVHAMGETATAARDGYADGRASTLLPLVRGPHRTVQNTLVLSLRRPVERRPDGSLDRMGSWNRWLSPGGRADSLVRFGAASPMPLSWLVDPAVVAAVEQLSEGNPARSLDPTLPEPGTGTTAPSPSGSESPSESGSASESPSATTEEEPDPTTLLTQQNARLATDFLSDAGDAMAGQDILLLPYGDVDAASAVARDGGWLTSAIKRSGDELAPWDLSGRSAVAPPNGLIDPTTLAAVPPETLVLAGEQSLAAPGPTVIEESGHEVVVADHSVARAARRGGHAQGLVELRQQLLAEGAVRALGSGEPMVSVLPASFPAGSGDEPVAEFFDGLAVGWLEATGLPRIQDDARPAPARWRMQDQPPSLDAANFSSAGALTDAGRLLDEVLYRNDSVADEVADEALTGLSHAAGRHPDRSRAAADRSTRWITRQLDLLQLQPTSVVLSSDTGSFNVTLVNGMDEPVEVQVRAQGSDEVTVAPSKAVRLQPGDRSTQLMEATSSKLGQHDVVLRLTTPDGTPIGPEEVVPVRANQVSRVIWVVIAIGAALLFGTILRRLVRRVRDWRRTRREEPA